MSSHDPDVNPTRADLAAALIRASRESSAAAVFFHTAIAERMGLGATDEKTLDILDRLGPQTAGELAAHTGLTTASVTSLIDRLERRGFVRRRRDNADRRRVIVEPDPTRVAEGEAFYVGVQAAFAPLVASYSDEQLAVIADFMTRAAALSRKLTEELPSAEPTPTDEVAG